MGGARHREGEEEDVVVAEKDEVRIAAGTELNLEMRGINIPTVEYSILYTHTGRARIVVSFILDNVKVLDSVSKYFTGCG